MEKITKNDIKYIISEAKKIIKTGYKNNFLFEEYGIKTNPKNLIELNEENAKNLLNKHGDTGFVIISASRNGDDFGLYNHEEEGSRDYNVSYLVNNDRTKELLKMIMKYGFSFKQVYGGTTENGKTVYEKSFMVFPFKKNGEHVDFSELKDFALYMCALFDQDSVLVAEPGENPKYYREDGTVECEFTGDTTFGDYTTKYFTDLRHNSHNHDNGKGGPSRFSFNECKLYINPKPSTLSEGHVRWHMGEVL